jgi:hypothetical protein
MFWINKNCLVHNCKLFKLTVKISIRSVVYKKIKKHQRNVKNKKNQSAFVSNVKSEKRSIEFIIYMTMPKNFSIKIMSEFVLIKYILFQYKDNSINIQKINMDQLTKKSKAVTKYQIEKIEKDNDTWKLKYPGHSSFRKRIKKDQFFNSNENNHIQIARMIQDLIHHHHISISIEYSFDIFRFWKISSLKSITFMERGK